MGGVGVFRAELREHRATLRAALPWCLVGSAAGTAVLLGTPASAFRDVVPWLIGAATLAFALAPAITRALNSAPVRARRRALLGPGVLVARAYGGYFGAGLGIVLLAVLAISLDEAILTLQGLRIALGLATNLLAAAVFVARGNLSAEAVAVLAVSTLVRVARRAQPAAPLADRGAPRRHRRRRGDHRAPSRRLSRPGGGRTATRPRPPRPARPRARPGPGAARAARRGRPARRRR